MSRTNFEELLEAGVHFGHLKKKYNPAMGPYVFMERNGIHIIDLNKTVAMLEDATAAMKQIANHGQTIRYHHEMIGCNSRLDSIQAAILRLKLRSLDNYCEARINAADYYDAYFADIKEIKTPVRDKTSKHVFHQYTMQLEGIDRDKLSEFLATKNIPSMIYYPIPAHKQKMFAHFNLKCTLPETDLLTTQVLSLPMHTELQEDQMKFIINSVLDCIK